MILTELIYEAQPDHDVTELLEREFHDGHISAVAYEFACLWVSRYWPPAIPS